MDSEDSEEYIDIEFDQEEIDEIVEIFNEVLNSGGSIADVINWLEESIEAEDDGLDFDIL
jgi:hypothetical protein